MDHSRVFLRYAIFTMSCGDNGPTFLTFLFFFSVYATVCRDGGLAPICVLFWCGHVTVCRDGGLAPIRVLCFVWACDGVSRRWSRSRPCLVLHVGMRRCVEMVVSLPSLSGASCGHATVCRDGGLAPVPAWCFVWACDSVSRRWSRSRPCLVLCVGMRRCVETMVSLLCMSSALHSGPGTACQDGDPAPTLGSVIFVRLDSGPAPTHAISGRALDCCKGVLLSSPLRKR
jgi:hypothetical protein